MSGPSRTLWGIAVATALVMSACAPSTTEESEQPESTAITTVTMGDGGAPTTPVSSPPLAPGAPGCWSGNAAGGTPGVSFADVTDSAGLVAPLIGMHAHAAAWGDSNADGIVDLFVGTFADRPNERYEFRGASSPSPDRLLLGPTDGVFTDSQFPEAFGRSSGAAFVDLDNDGDLDLVVSRNAKTPGKGPVRPAHELGTAVYESINGEFVERPGAGIDAKLGGRSIGVLDYDSDGLYDLFIVEDRFRGGSSRLFRNLGGFQFADTTTDAGIPLDLNGLGVATADVDGDRDVDIFIGGSNQLLIADGDSFDLADSTVFSWEPAGTEDDPAGVAFGDVDRDGRPDLVIGQHFGSTLSGGEPVPVRLFLNRTEAANRPLFVEATTSGLTPLPTKAPHVEIADLDNDGWPDIVTSASAANGTRPAVFLNEGFTESGGTFTPPEGIGSTQYWVTAPVSDYDRDGRLDIFAVEWEPSLPSLLFRNESASGNWLNVSVGPELGFGLGGRVIAYEQGGLGDPTRILGSADITATRGYATGVEAVAHFGLGDIQTVDIEVIVPRGDPMTLTDVPANQSIRLPGGCTAD